MQGLDEFAGGGVVKLVRRFVEVEQLRAGDEGAGEVGEADLGNRCFEYYDVVDAVARRVEEVGA